MSDDEPIIGIDLGTTNSVVSIFENNAIKMFYNELGNNLIPSYIAFENEDKMLVGDMAKSKLGQKYIALIYDAKRLIGRNCDDPNVIKDKQNWPFKIKADPNTNKPIIVVKAKINLIKHKETNDFDFYKKHVLNESDLFRNSRHYAFKIDIPTVEKELTPEEVS